MMTRRKFMAATLATGIGSAAFHTSASYPDRTQTRTYHVCLRVSIAEKEPELLDIVRDAGVTDVWQASFGYGHWWAPPDKIREGRRILEAHGLRGHIINLALGHPGDALGDPSGVTALTPPSDWHMGIDVDGKPFSGTSLHPEGEKENVKAVKALAQTGGDCIFLDDDFRLARYPGKIGGCFCPWHKQRFLEKYGYNESQWKTLKADIKHRNLSPLLRHWLEMCCDELTGCFRAMEQAAGHTRIGNMVMYLGAEKAGIRLQDYVNVPFRVGELMFNDHEFDQLNRKTDELFSVLFHRRYARPELAFSETTAYPADKLSAANMAAKLVISTIADVRNTMFMSGMNPFPREHWQTLKPAMRKQAMMHEVVKGHQLRGPFKHYWGEASRLVGKDQPFSLFLATGIPFEVTGSVTGSGWFFLSDEDARALRSQDVADGVLFARPEVKNPAVSLRPLPQTLEALWKIKHEAIRSGIDAPYVMEDIPMVCAWYPTASRVLLWNPMSRKATAGLQWKGREIPFSLGPLDSTLITL